MSLKAFHIFFITISVLCAFGFGAWLFEQYTQSGKSITMLFGVVSLGVGFGLIIYGIKFLKKLKHVSFI